MPGIRRREFIALLGSGVAARPLPAYAQQSRSPRIGVLVLTRADAQSLGNELREGLRELGYVEGRNFAFEFSSADGDADRLSDLAAELVRLRVDVIVAAYTPCALAAKRATSSIPIVMAAVADPIGAGLVQSLARPGGNISGFSNMAPETAGKCVDLFRDMIPSLRRVAVLANPVDPFTNSLLDQVRLAGSTGGIEIAPVAMVRELDEVEAAFADMSSKQAQAVVVQAIFFAKGIAELAIKYRLPSAAVLRSYPYAGGLMSYGADVPHLFRRSAATVHKILQGRKIRGPAGRATDEIRARRQPQDRNGDRFDCSRVHLAACRRGDRIRSGRAPGFVHEPTVGLSVAVFPHHVRPTPSDSVHIRGTPNRGRWSCGPRCDTSTAPAARRGKRCRCSAG
jgi:putative tryptophan/tyrosine transport system substrate-binding protein